MKKSKIKAATQEEFEAVAYQAITKMEAASIGELQAALVGLAELYVSVTADCPNLETERGAALAIIIKSLEENIGAPCLPGTGQLETMAPVSNFSN